MSSDFSFERPPLGTTGYTRDSLLAALKDEVAAPSDAVAVATLYADEIEQAIIDLLGRARIDELDRPSGRLLFRGIHILGGRRLTAAYRALTAFLRGPQQHVDDLLGDAITETLARILAGLFDGDTEPLLALIADSAVDEFIREAALKAFAFLTFDGRIERPFTEDFLARFERESTAPVGDMIWHGWMTSVALLGLDSLSPRVRIAFEDGRIPDEVADESHYQELLAAAWRRPTDPERFESENLGYINDVLETLQGWFVDQETDPAVGAASDSDFAWRPPFLPGLPVHNPLRPIGRNDPCPCGSGKKFKKCCLAQAG